MQVHCATCGEPHDLSDLDVGFTYPDAYFAVRPDEREARWMVHSDLMALDGERFFIRGLVQIPVRGGGRPFAWGAWVRVAKEDFDRYEALYDDPNRGGDPPFPGRLATQLPGYPQTLGLAVSVQPNGDEMRPSFTVLDTAHPLAAEQREGIWPERLLEHVSAVLHADRPPPLGSPRFATLEEERWRVLDAVRAYAERDRVLWLPDEEVRRAVPVGAIAKAVFEIVASDEEGEPAVHAERMWVDIDHRREEGGAVLYSGFLANDPFNPGLTRRGMRVWLSADHVVDVQTGPDEPLASAAADLRCRNHGPSRRNYVCRHVAEGEGRGFNAAEDEGNPRPDAWCDACEAVLKEEGWEWTDRAEAFADIVGVCGACYDDIEERNRRD
jgi:hypothetical protein